MRSVAGRLVVAALLAGACWTGPLPDRDRGALLTIRDLGTYGIQEAKGPAQESFKRTTYLDGSYDMQYEFKSGSDSGRISLTVIVDIERNIDYARADVLLSRTMGAGLKIAGVTLLQDSAASYGDESHFATIMKPSGPVGYLVVVRGGVVVYTVVLLGVVFDTADEWQFLLEPKFAFIDAMRSSRP